MNPYFIAGFLDKLASAWNKAWPSLPVADRSKILRMANKDQVPGVIQQSPENPLDANELDAIRQGLQHKTIPTMGLVNSAEGLGTAPGRNLATKQKDTWLQY